MVAVVLVLPERLVEDEVLGDAAQLRVDRGGEALRLRASGSIPKSDVWNAMRATSRPIVSGRAGVDLAVVEGGAPDPQVARGPPSRSRTHGIEAVVRGDRVPRERLIGREGVRLVAGTLEGQRPALAVDAHPRQRLLQDDARGGPGRPAR